MTYPKRTVDLEVGDIVCMYGARDRVTKVESVHPEHRYTAVTVMMETLRWNGTTERTGEPRFVCLDNNYVHVEIPKGYKVIAVPEDES